MLRLSYEVLKTWPQPEGVSGRPNNYPGKKLSSHMPVGDFGATHFDKFIVDHDMSLKTWED